MTGTSAMYILLVMEKELADLNLTLVVTVIGPYTMTSLVKGGLVVYSGYAPTYDEAVAKVESYLRTRCEYEWHITEKDLDLYHKLISLGVGPPNPSVGDMLRMLLNKRRTVTFTLADDNTIHLQHGSGGVITDTSLSNLTALALIRALS